jgi:hypothetical protein
MMMEKKPMASYLEEVAALRQEAAVRQMENVQEEVRRLRDEVYEAERLASEASAGGDRDTALYYAEMANTAEQQYIAAASQLPQMPQQPDATVTEFAQQYRPWLEKHGQRAIDVLTVAHGYATRPRTGSANPASTGMGLAYGSEQYKTAMKDLLGMYAKDYGVPFDPGEAMIGPDEAARISNVDARTYNEAVRKMYADGKDSASEQGAWDREVG